MRVEPALLVSQVTGLIPVYFVSRLGDGRSEYGVALAILAFSVVAIGAALGFAFLHKFLLTHTTGSLSAFLVTGLLVGGVCGIAVASTGGGLRSGEAVFIWFVWVFVLTRVLIRHDPGSIRT